MTAALAVLLALAPADSARAPCVGGEVLTRADLRAGGALAVHDIVQLSAALDGVTVDGFDAEPLAAWGVPRAVRLLVDGAPVASTTALEPLGLEPLPVAIGEIERVTVCPGPGLAGGVWGGPWIDIETARPGHVYAAGVYGNETGDPGPALYLDPSLPNVDRWGPDAEGALGARRGRTDVWALIRQHRILPTDTAVAPRVFAVFAPADYPSRVGTSAAMAAAGPLGRLRASLHRASDLPFLPALGTETPADRRTLQGTASASRTWGNRTVQGHVHAARLGLNRTDGSRLVLGTNRTAPDWTEHRASAAASVRVGGAARAVAFGVQGEVTRAEGLGLRDPTAGAARVWAALMPAGGDQELAVQVTTGSTGLLVGGVARAGRHLGPGTRATVTLALDRQPPPADGLAVWLRRGYTGLDGGLVASSSAPERTETVALARLDLAAPLPAGGRLAVSVEAQRSDGLAETERFAVRGTTVGGALRFERATGTAGVARARAAWDGRGWQTAVSVRAQTPLAGDGPFRNAWSRVPSAQADARLALQPDAGLTLWAAVRVRTEASWDGTASRTAPAVALVDLGLSKRAWGDRLDLALTGRNVLDAQERTHPLGAVLAPRLFVRAAVRL